MEAYHIVALECSHACAGEQNLENRFRKSMAAARNHWMAPNDQDQFKGAIGGVLMAKETTEPEKERINSTVRSLQAINAAINGVPVDLAAVLQRQEDGPEPLPLVKWWHEVKEAA